MVQLESNAGQLLHTPIRDFDWSERLDVRSLHQSIQYPGYGFPHAKRVACFNEFMFEKLKPGSRRIAYVLGVSVRRSAMSLGLVTQSLFHTRIVLQPLCSM